jgi:hypothetical protein
MTPEHILRCQAGGVTQVVEQLTSEHKVLNSNPNTTRKGKVGRRKERKGGRGKGKGKERKKETFSHSLQTKPEQEVLIPSTQTVQMTERPGDSKEFPSVFPLVNLKVKNTITHMSLRRCPFSTFLHFSGCTSPLLFFLL